MVLRLEEFLSGKISCLIIQRTAITVGLIQRIMQILRLKRLLERIFLLLCTMKSVTVWE